MRSTALLDFLDGIERLNIDESAKRQVRGLVNSIGLDHGVKRIAITKRVDLARQLLDLHISRTSIMERIKAAFGVSKEQAYRDIRAALKLCQKTRPFATTGDQNKQCDGKPPLLAANEGE